MTTSATMTIIPMGAKEAKELTEYVREGFADRKDALVQIYERRGWKAMGYSRWEEYFRVEIEPSMPDTKCLSVNHMNFLVRAQAVQAIVGAPTIQIPQRILRELDRLPDAESKREVWAQAQELNGSLTSAKAAELVDAKLGTIDQEAEELADAREAEKPAKAPGRPKGASKPKNKFQAAVKWFTTFCNEARRRVPHLGKSAKKAGDAVEKLWKIVRKAVNTVA